MNGLLDDIFWSTHELQIDDAVSVLAPYPGICVLVVQNVDLILLCKKARVGYDALSSRHDDLVHLLLWLGKVEILAGDPLQNNSLQITWCQNPWVGKMDKGHDRHRQNPLLQNLCSLGHNDGAVWNKVDHFLGRIFQFRIFQVDLAYLKAWCHELDNGKACWVFRNIEPEPGFVWNLLPLQIKITQLCLIDPHPRLCAVEICCKTILVAQEILHLFILEAGRNQSDNLSTVCTDDFLYLTIRTFV